MNMLAGRIKDRAFVDGGGTRWPLPPAHAGREGAEVVYGIRPERLRLDPNGIQARIQVVEPTGSETQVQLRVGDVAIMGAFRERIAANHGDVLAVLPDLNLVHLFDKASGQRI
jgi:multiple sugar transport system ATP-binding protein